ncbi:MAG: diguanylate cyclase [Gammaproteobacteria bacterium]|nr:diguanylate cyclase [Gammaproteobacteria bacterium]
MDPQHSNLNSQYLKGWSEAFLAVLVLMAISNVFSRYSIVILEVNAIVYFCAAFSSAALVMLLIGGSGVLARESLRSLDTWLYGFLLMFGYILTMALFSFITSTEGTMVQKISVIIALFIGWFFLGREPTRFHLLGTLLATIGIIIVLAGIDPSIRGPVYLLAFMYGAVQAGRIFTAELHRPHNTAMNLDSDPKARIRVLGFVMFIVSIMFTALALSIAMTQIGQATPFFPGLPMLTDFVHPETLIAGMAAGVLIIAPIRVLEFSSTSIIKGENYAAVLTLTFVSTFVWEWATAPITGLSIEGISYADLLAGILITAGGLVVAFDKIRRHGRTDADWRAFVDYMPQDIRLARDSHELALGAINHFKGNRDKAALALDLPASVLEVLASDQANVLGFNSKIFSKVARNYRHNVSTRDPLTELINRGALTTAINRAIHNETPFDLLYLDLNDFKPINDQFGHEAGDALLIVIAQRLRENLPNDSKVARLGGDEFCAIVPCDHHKEHRFDIKTLRTRLSEGISISQTDELLTVGASIGVASFPKDGGSSDALLSAADRAMYRDKANSSIR